MDLAHSAAVILDRHNLIKYDRRTGNMQVSIPLIVLLEPCTMSRHCLHQVLAFLYCPRLINSLQYLHGSLTVVACTAASLHP